MFLLKHDNFKCKNQFTLQFLKELSEEKQYGTIPRKIAGSPPALAEWHMCGKPALSAEFLLTSHTDGSQAYISRQKLRS